ncbi:MAG: class I SAM-dependent methyltransferase [Rhodospirillaceae bacterium]|jgi:SAM-dependent methyltransferase|nr:class I SAM-dependent methyltransferase [Rhodospirillaceae bacterium]MBT5565950.1 class I SAM-dependent methyltransferase [Rhodospirillaceae bacterium]MBT6088630.1 class I SAM-dependent methyltransferase [Rhodospirillaceae bacterium]MBT7450606.1 class I SAM-dependent methyltransferase [Rhodospirillaceae bacterium]
MREQAAHPMMPVPTHDEAARTDFVYHLSNFIRSDITPHNKTVYEQTVRPAFVKSHGRAPKTRQEVRKAMLPTREYRMSSALQRCSQEMMWSSVAETVERQLPDMITHFRNIAGGPVKGSLTLNPEMPIPSYLDENHHHCMAGGYHTEVTEDDVGMGAVYDRGAFIYVDGNFGPRNDGLGVALTKYIQTRFRGFKPTRILDMGCTVGASTVALKEGFPDAEVWGIDTGGPCLRYGHGRAEHLGVAVNYSQQNAEHTDFDDQSFDLVVSAGVLHETGHQATLNVLKESRRLLKPGGIMVHQEIQPYRHEDPWLDFTRDWDSFNNNEPFWGTILDMDLPAVAKTQGWNDDDVFSEIGFGPAEAHSIQPEVEAEKVMGASRGARGMSYLCGTRSS